ncbi:protein lin-9 homolog [Teleopsis dalmanni]|uniref:protein lin-9 homolog n=1 Tax=Teleopsis dalmanni TaxID=139649 RepID=UPI0018CD0592|nr:protein lin-9 homolog [Teleopsis dalmanni]XP_037931981.1 protein lin-9 homolog [Teleopsis dalmanni]
MSAYSDTPRKKNKRNITPSFSDDEHIEPPSFSLATLGLQRVGTEPPKPKMQSALPIQMLNARGMPARIRKRNRLFFDDNIINDDKPLRMSLSPRKTPVKATNISPARTPSSKVLRKRKSMPTSYLRLSEKKKKLDDSPTSSKVSYISNSLFWPLKPSKEVALPKSATIEEENDSDKKLGHLLGIRLRNLLKLPKAHKWVFYEWFYSFLDKQLLLNENEFQVCLNEHFPGLQTRNLNLIEWRKIRSMLGKPRRCSQAFLDEERRELERKRQKIRYLQSRRGGDIKDMQYVRDLPHKIPLPLPIGTRVTARLRVPQDGIFSGMVDAFDSLSSLYRITFDRAGLGTHSIPDYEIASDNFFEMLPLQSIAKDFRPNLSTVLTNSAANNMTPLKNMRNGRDSMNLNKSDPLLAQEIIESPFKTEIFGRERINGYPAKLLETIVRLKRALAIKRTKLQRLCNMNNEAEINISQEMPINNNALSDDSQQLPEPSLQVSEEFQRRYASIVISMEKLNRDIQDYLNDVQAYTAELTRDPQVQAMLAPSYLREKCREAAQLAVQKNNQGILKNKRILTLIENLSTVLLVASHLGADGKSNQVSKIMEGCIEEVKSSIEDINVDTFQKHIKIHLHHIRLGIGQSIMLANNNNSN